MDFRHSLITVAMGVIIVRLLENTQASVPVAVLCHTTINLSLALFPVAGVLLRSVRHLSEPDDRGGRHRLHLQSCADGPVSSGWDQAR